MRTKRRQNRRRANDERGSTRYDAASIRRYIFFPLERIAYAPSIKSLRSRLACVESCRWTARTTHPSEFATIFDRIE